MGAKTLYINEVIAMVKVVSRFFYGLLRGQKNPEQLLLATDFNKPPNKMTQLNEHNRYQGALIMQELIHHFAAKATVEFIARLAGNALGERLVAMGTFPLGGMGLLFFHGYKDDSFPAWQV